MPKITIRETDLTGANNLIYNDYVTLIPGKFKTGIESGTNIAKLVYTVEKLDEIADKDSIAYKEACKLLELGMVVLYADTNRLDYKVFEKEFADKSKYDIRFIIRGDASPSNENGGIDDDTLIKVAALRGDAIAIIDRENTTSEAVETSIKELNNDPIDPTNTDGRKEEIKLSYAMCMANKVVIDEKEFPGSIGYLTAFGSHITKYPAWFAMAGSIRGVLPYGKVETPVEFGDADINTLQVRSVEKESTDEYRAANMICEIKPFGHIVWGNRTLAPVDGVHYELQASHFLNIRHLCCDIKKTLYRASRKYTFEPNSDVLWVNFTSEITPLLERMKSNQGIRGYRLTRERVSKKALLKAKITIVPIEAVEDFDLTVEMGDSLTITE